MALSKPHPLRTPEVVYHIGWFLLQDDEDGDYVYNKNVANCTKVNSLWRQTMTPLLWVVFDAEVALHRNIPLSPIQPNSHHFRYVHLNPVTMSPILHSTRLRELHLLDMEPQAIWHLMHSNPQLEVLKISLGSDSLAFNLKYILEPLSRLKQLQLVNGIDVYVDLLLRAICHLTNLKKLTWHCLAKTKSIGARQPQPDNDNIDNINTTMTTRLLDTAHFQIDSIMELTLDCCHWYSNPDLPQLVRFFPSLKSFYIRLSKYGPWYFPSDELSRNLRESCPHLEGIRIVNVAGCTDFRLYMDSHLHLLKATSRLMHYDLPIYSLDSTFCTALLAHASFLQTVHIYCGSVSETHFHSASLILASCHNLASFLFRLTDSPRGQSTRQDGILALFDKPWNCPNLKDFELHGFKPDPRQPVGQRISAMYMELLSLRGSGNAHHGGSTMRLRPRISNNTQVLAGGGRSQSGTDHTPPTNTHSGQPISPISDWIERVARRKSNTNFSEMMANRGWTTKQGAANWWRRGVDNMELSKIKQIVQDMVFSRVIFFPHMCKLTLEEFDLIKKGRAA